MASDSLQLRIMFFPQLSYGHMIPTVDTARLFARNGVKVTIATTPLNASLFANLIQREKVSGSDIDTCIIKFPSAEAGLPQGCENVSSITSPEMSLKFFKALSLLHRPLEELLEQRRPDCLVADVTFPWATDIATKFGIPRLLNEIAKGLEASGQDFIWVLKKGEKQEWLPEGFEERVKGKGLMIRGWAPQVLILDHEAVGGFITHCGWNSTIESISAGVPMVTWPLYAEQFCNEKLVTDVLKIGVDVGAKEWHRWVDDTKFSVTKEDIERAVTRIMVGKEAEGIRNRARALKDMARKAAEGGGSSYSDLNALLEELRLNCL
ncbi:hypothetical protein SCA6_009514 [Theobroma cacao]